MAALLVMMGGFYATMGIVSGILYYRCQKPPEEEDLHP